MNRDPSDLPERLDAFVRVARQLDAPSSPQQYEAGWQRLRRARASGALPEATAAAWWSRGGLRLGLAFALVALLIPVGWRLSKTSGPPPLAYTVSGESGVAAHGEVGGVVAARTGAVRLQFSDGSHVGLRAAARLIVAAVKANGSDVRLLDGIIDVDVRHRADTAWTFEAGPYTLYVRGTSFSVGWNAAQKRLDLKMLTGLVELKRPAGAASLAVAGGTSVRLDEAGNLVPDLVPTDSAAIAPPPEAPAQGASPSALPSPVGDATPAGRGVRNRISQEHRPARAKPVRLDWAALLARGAFAPIVEQAQKIGVDVCLGSDTESNLAALADAARYTHRNDLARKALLALRARFPATARARDAAFFLGRLSEKPGATGGEELSWYERYLQEAADGSYAEEALGRQLILLLRQDRGNDGGKSRGGSARTRGVAARYLKAYPRGIYAHEAAGVLASPLAP